MKLLAAICGVLLSACATATYQPDPARVAQFRCEDDASAVEQAADSRRRSMDTIARVEDERGCTVITSENAAECATLIQDWLALSDDVRVLRGRAENTRSRCMSLAAQADAAEAARAGQDRRAVGIAAAALTAVGNGFTAAGSVQPPRTVTCSSTPTGGGSVATTCY
jgi:hypothetical protein